MKFTLLNGNPDRKNHLFKASVKDLSSAILYKLQNKFIPQVHPYVELVYNVNHHKNQFAKPYINL